MSYVLRLVNSDGDEVRAYASRLPWNIEWKTNDRASLLIAKAGSYTVYPGDDLTVEMFSDADEMVEVT